MTSFMVNRLGPVVTLTLLLGVAAAQAQSGGKGDQPPGKEGVGGQGGMMDGMEGR